MPATLPARCRIRATARSDAEDRFAFETIAPGRCAMPPGLDGAARFAGQTPPAPGLTGAAR